jgi:hypothetical protein
MDHKRRVHAIISSAAILAAVFTGTLPAQAQIGGFGTSSAGGSGGIPTGPTNFTGIYGQSSSGGSGGFSTGPTNFSTSGFGLSTGAGSGGRATGPTNPSLPSFGGPAPTSSNTRAFGGGPTSNNSFGIPNIMVPEGSASSQPSPPGTGGR